MSGVGGGLALAALSAIASSSAHAFLKTGEDKFAVQAWSCLIGALLALPFVFWTGLPESAILPWLLAGWVLHCIYYVVLIWSYRSSDFSVAYPIARGVIPISTAILGVALLGDKLGPLAFVGIAIISTGIILLSYRGGISREGILAACMAGLINTCFTLVDAKGMRVADSMLNFLVWYYVLDGIFMPLLFWARAKGRLRTLAITNSRNGVGAGILALFSFLPALIAYRLAPVGAVSAIRATSVIFSLFIGGGLLRERLDGRRIGGAVMVTIGALAIIGSAALA